MKSYFIATLFCLISIASSAQNSLLFEISGNGLSKPSYLYGTIHMICAKDFVMKESIKNKLAESEQIALEIDMDDPQMTKKVMTLGSYKDGITIQNFMSDSDYSKLSMFFKDSLGMNLKMLERFKPVVLYSFIATKMLTCDIKSYEMEFVKEAQKQKKEVVGLETVEFQMDIFNKMTNEDLAKLLMDFVNDFSKSKNEFAEMVKNYKQQDTEKLLSNIKNNSSSVFNGYMEDFLDKRNADWIDKISAISKEKSTFYAVGAGHLGGEMGVLKLLKSAGFTVKAIE